MVAGKFRPPRSPAEIERFQKFVHEVVNNASIIVVESPTTLGTQDVPAKLSPADLEEFQNCGTINGTYVPPVVIRPEDGAELVVGPDGAVYEVDAEVHKDVNEFGFDSLGRFFPLKGMSEVYLHTWIHIHVYTYVYIHTYVLHTYIRIYVLHTCIRIYIHTYIHTYV
jgi:hypothetical protein